MERALQLPNLLHPLRGVELASRYVTARIVRVLQRLRGTKGNLGGFCIRDCFPIQLRKPIIASILLL
jgi:hypothetical protein